MEKSIEIEKIIKAAPKGMQAMLSSIYEYNSRFLIDKEQEKLLSKILFAIQHLDRRYFVEDDEVYNDYALPITAGQTISQPSTVARMIILAEVEQGDDILEIGTGSGWNAALIAYLAYPGHITSVERIASLKEYAEKNLAKLKGYIKQKKPEDFQKLSKINLFADNIFGKGKVWKQRYNKIIFTAGIASEEDEKNVENLASNLLKQSGILICPRVEGKMLIYKKEKFLKRFETKEDYVFVPLINHE